MSADQGLIYVAGRHVTAEKEAQEALRKGEADAAYRQKMEALGQLTGGVAHDFNNLMMVVNNNAYLLASTIPQAKDSPQLASILRAIESGTRLTRQLLAFARRQPLHPQVLDLHRALPGMAELMRSTAGGGVKLGVHVAPDTPPVLADPAELEMALINLAANARDAMNRSGELEILARAAEPGEGPDAGKRYALVSVSDTGHGISAENLSRVFDPFFTTKPPGSGTGLGLSQVYGFCHQAGGGVQLESEVGLGTTVSLFLPATDIEALDQQDTKAAQQRLAMRVLLVEDNAEVSVALGALLGGLGCTVVRAATADEAAALLAREPVDVVLSDIVMPGEKDGIAFALELRERKPPLPAVLMTGYARETARARGAGIEVLQKPCPPKDVAEALVRAVGRTQPAAA
jgi:nitrogen-specific signal transduction histidine kinase/ActR/RegA family two-component response regulator